MKVYLTLGGVTFSNFEVPERINFGGSQALAVKQLVGGQRIIDAMGRVDDDITWSGLMFESEASERAQLLDRLRMEGLPLLLTWGLFNYLVVIRSFKANFERFYQIPYSITVTVIENLNVPFALLTPITYNDAILSMLGQANTLTALVQDAALVEQMATLTTTINAVPSLQNATPTQLIPTVTQLGLSANLVNSLVTSTSSSVFTTPEAANIESENISKLNYLYQMQSILRNMYANILLIEEGAAGQIITVQNANLFQLAAKYYGDAKKWTAIAEANGLVDYFVEVTITATPADPFSLVFGGIPTGGQVITLALTIESNTVIYRYLTKKLDTLVTIAAALAQLIPTATSDENVLILPEYENLNVSIERIINLTIPQTAQDSGGIWGN